MQKKRKRKLIDAYVCVLCILCKCAIHEALCSSSDVYLVDRLTGWKED